VTPPPPEEGGAPALVSIGDHDAVRLVTFERPEARNAFNKDLYLGVAGALADAAADDAVHVVVLTGSGGSFSVGQDLKEMAAMVTGASTDPDAAKGFRSFMDAVCGFEKPLLAAVNGVGVGLGFTVLAHCDLVLMAEDARLKVPFAELGVPAEAASSLLFPIRMGWQRAAEVLLTGTWVSASEAVECGIALRTCPPDALLAETMALAAQIAAHPPGAVRAIKRLMLATQAPLVAAAREREDAAFSELLGSPSNTAALDRFGETGRLT
jgi:enoyl-CoA hydratase/carnithine racemase